MDDRVEIRSLAVLADRRGSWFVVGTAGRTSVLALGESVEELGRLRCGRTRRTTNVKLHLHIYTVRNP